MQPRLSVVMPVRDALPYLDEAIESILGQSFGDFEFVIGDDGSTECSLERLREWARLDRRIRVLESPVCLGPVGSSNRVAAEARSPIVARMDADDVARSDRFRRQFEALREDEEAVLVGCLFDCIDGDGNIVREASPASLLSPSFSPPISHGSIMYRREAFLRAGGYRPHCAYFEDQDLYLRMSAVGRVLIIPEVLFSYRFAAQNGRLRHPQEKVLLAVGHYYDCRAKHGDARDPFAEAPPGHAERVAPIAIVALAGLALWAGRRPRAIALLLRRGRLGFGLTTALSIGWALWAAIAPASLRAVLRLRHRWRNAGAARRLDPNGRCEWRRQSPQPEQEGREALVLPGAAA